MYAIRVRKVLGVLDHRVCCSVVILVLSLSGVGTKPVIRMFSFGSVFRSESTMAQNADNNRPFHSVSLMKLVAGVRTVITHKIGAELSQGCSRLFCFIRGRYYQSGVQIPSSLSDNIRKLLIQALYGQGWSGVHAGNQSSLWT